MLSVFIGFYNLVNWVLERQWNHKGEITKDSHHSCSVWQTVNLTCGFSTQCQKFVARVHKGEIWVYFVTVLCDWDANVILIFVIKWCDKITGKLVKACGKVKELWLTTQYHGNWHTWNEDEVSIKIISICLWNLRNRYIQHALLLHHYIMIMCITLHNVKISYLPMRKQCTYQCLCARLQ